MSERTAQRMFSLGDPPMEREPATPAAKEERWDNGVYADRDAWESALKRHCREAGMDGVQTEMLLLYAEERTVEEIRRLCKPRLHGQLMSARAVRIALDVAIARIEGRIPHFGKYAAEFRKQLLFCLQNKGGVEMPLPPVITPAPAQKLPQGMPIITSSDRRLAQGRTDKFKLWARGTNPSVLVRDPAPLTV